MGPPAAPARDLTGRGRFSFHIFHGWTDHEASAWEVCFVAGPTLCTYLAGKNFHAVPPANCRRDHVPNASRNQLARLRLKGTINPNLTPRRRSLRDLARHRARNPHGAASLALDQPFRVRLASTPPTSLVEAQGVRAEETPRTERLGTHAQSTLARLLDLTVVLPTFNEAGHIAVLLTELGQHLEEAAYEILVVDDDSPDGTFGIVGEASASNPRIRAILRTTEKGLATAIVEGMRAAQGRFIVVMDSDGQHPPAAVGRLLEAAAATGADLVIGSRYAPGGTAGAFPWHRRLISWGARTLAKLSLSPLRHHRLRDPMSGFFLIRRDRLPPLDGLRPTGYKILLELLGTKSYHRIVEVGYEFQRRRTGKSKLGLRTQWDYIHHLARLTPRDPENLRVLAFSLVGLSGVFVNLAPMVLVENWLGETSALRLLFWAIASRELAVLWNFAWNDLVAFRDLRAASGHSYLGRLLRYHAATLASFGLYAVIFYGLTLLGMAALTATGIAILLGFVSNYVANRRWSYAPSRVEGEPTL